MSLVEVMISVAVLGIVALSTLSASQLLMQSTDYGDRSQAVMALASQIRERVKYSDLCDASIGPTSNYNQNNFNPAAPEIRLKIPNIKSGVTMLDDFISQGQIVPSMRLHIDSLRLTELTNISGSKYVAQVVMSASAIDGLPYKSVHVSTVQFEIQGVSPNMSISKCIGIESGVTKTICENMGCAWDILLPVKCSCLQANGMCPLGEVPVAVKLGMPDCRPIGGKACGANEYLVGVMIEKSHCAPVL